MSEWFLKVKLVDVVECLPTGVEAYDGEKDYYSTGSVQDESIVPEGRFTHKNKPSRANRLARKGDVLQARMKKTDKGHLVGEQLNEHLISTGFIQVRPYEKTILSEYVFYYLKSWEFLSQRDTFSSGSTQEALTDAGLLNISFPLVGPLTQNKIVQKIEELFSEIDAGTEALKRVEANLKRYRASVLKAACEGKLVPTEAELAKKEGREYEPASVLLERILKERREKWQKENPGKKYKEPKAPDTKDLPELPEGWVWASLGYAFDVHVGATPRRNESKYWGGDIPWVSSGEVAFCRIKSTKERISEAGYKNSSTTLHPIGTVLIGMIGEGKTRGQVAILDVKATHNQNSAAIRVSDTEVVPEYIYYFLQGKYEETRRAGSGNNQPALNKQRVMDIIFPLPPIREQYRIVAEADKLSSVIDKLKVTIAQTQSDGLKQSILKKAFSGQLVPQDPNDEPASVLLERIKEVRAKRETEVKTKKTITRKPQTKKKTS